MATRRLLVAALVAVASLATGKTLIDSPSKLCGRTVKLRVRPSQLHFFSD